MTSIPSQSEISNWFNSLESASNAKKVTLVAKGKEDTMKELGISLPRLPQVPPQVPPQAPPQVPPKVPSKELKVLSWNISWEAMTAIKSGTVDGQQYCSDTNATEGSKCLDNVIKFIEDQIDINNFDLIFLQEASKNREITPKIEAKNSNYENFYSQSDREDMITYWDSEKLTIKENIAGEFRQGRPFQVLIFEELVAINIHPGHQSRDDSNKNWIKKDTYDLLEEKVEALYPVHTDLKDALKTKPIIIAGDFNNNLSSGTTFFGRNFNGKNTTATCCINDLKDGTNYDSGAYDHILYTGTVTASAVPDISDYKPSSDHLPVVSMLDLGSNDTANIVSPIQTGGTKLTAVITPVDYYTNKDSRRTDEENSRSLRVTLDGVNTDKWSEWVKIFNKIPVVNENSEDDWKSEGFQLVSNEKNKELFDEVKTKYVKEYGLSQEWDSDKVFAQKVIIPDNSKILIVGDFHSSFHSLRDMIQENRDMFDGDTMKLKPDNYIFFLGDLIDRGSYSIEVLYLALYIKNQNWDQVYIINGNHEDMEIYSRYGALFEMIYQLSEKLTDLEYIDKTLWYLPSVIYMKYNEEWYHLSHGAFDPEFAGFDIPSDKSDIIYTLEPTNTDSRLKEFLDDDNQTIVQVMECTKTQKKGCDSNQFKWGDFYNDIESLGNKPYNYGFNPTGRDRFGPGLTQTYLEKNGIKCILSGHQDAIPLGLVIQKDKYESLSDKKEITISGQTFEWHLPEPKYDYRFYGFPKPKSNMNQKTEIILNPGEDFIALVTSTAVISKHLCCDAWLIMETQ